MPSPPQIPPSASPSISVVVVGADPVGLRRTLAALAAQVDAPAEVIVSAGWPGASPPAEVVESFPGARVVSEAGIGPSAAANAGLAVATGDVLLLLAAGDVAPPGLIADHRSAHAAGADVVAADVAGAPVARSAWVGLRPGAAPATWSRHVSATRGVLRACDGLDDRLRDLDVAVLDLLVRAAATGSTVVARPDLVVGISGAPTDDDARRAGHSAQLLDHLVAERGGALVRGDRRRAAPVLRWAAPVLRRLPGGRSRPTRLRAAFATGRGLPPLPAYDHDRCGLTATAHGTSRPSVAIVVPFAGDTSSATTLMDHLHDVRRAPEDEVVVADNSARPVAQARDGITVVRADGEHTSYHARNVGSASATADWLLFTDGDCVPVPWILDAFFSPAPAPRTGAVAGAVLDPQDAASWVGRYSADAAVLSQGRALNRRPLPYGVTACLLVRRSALEEIGGFTEGILSSGDVDLCWRLQQAGWELEHRPRAAVEHRHRATLGGLVRQYRRYGAGNAWLTRRWPGTEPGWPLLWRPGALRAVLADVVAARPRTARMRALDLVCEWSAAYGARSDNAPGPAGNER